MRIRNHKVVSCILFVVFLTSVKWCHEQLYKYVEKRLLMSTAGSWNNNYEIYI